MKSAALLLAATITASAEPQVIHDAAILAAFEKKVGALAELDAFPTAQKLKKSLEEAPPTAAEGLEIKSSPAASSVDAVFLIGSVYKCGRCENWHPGGIATAWSIGTDGLMVTNQHVFAHASGKVMAVCDRHGNAYPITEILAADAASDVALFRVKADSLPTLSLGDPAAIGTDVEVISHPHRNFFFHTFGKVARYTSQPSRDDSPETLWMSITADFAKGSSGGPVLAGGAVVGMVASTRSIYYESEDGSPKGPLQMVIKDCVPGTAIKKLLGSPVSRNGTPQPALNQR